MLKNEIIKIIKVAKSNDFRQLTIESLTTDISKKINGELRYINKWDTTYLSIYICNGSISSADLEHFTYENII